MKRSEAFKRHKINILGVNVDDISEVDAVKTVLRLAEAKNKGKFVVTVNSEFVMMAQRDPHFAQILNDADLALPDGQWIVNSKLILGGREHDRVSGVDLVENLCKLSANKAIRVGFLGGFSSVAKEASKRQKIMSPKLKVVFSDPGDPSIGYDLRLKGVFERIGRVDILFVAYGMGQQEFWIERMKNKLDVGVYIGVGGAFDYISGVKLRAPKFMQELGFEWLWRLVLDPVRIWRMRVLPLFAILVFWQILKNYKKRIFTNNLDNTV